MQRLGAVACLIGLLAIGVLDAQSHPGGLNSEGCHFNRKTGDYHCHGGTQRSSRQASAVSAANAIVKKSRRNICHTIDSPWYDVTTNYTAYATLKACVDSGGRLPRG
jgi:uncharacterized membrane protein